MAKVLFLSSLAADSNVRVGEHKYAFLFSAAGYDVFNLGGVLNPYKFISNNPEDIERVRNWRAGVRAGKDTILSYTPFCYVPYVNAPVLNSMIVARNCLTYCYPDLRYILRTHGFDSPDILFVNNIRMFSAAKLVRSKFTMIRVSDRIEGFKNVPPNVVRYQTEVVSQCDMVIATSQALCRELARINPVTHYVPNGVDRSFLPEEHEQFIRPSDMKDIPSPIVIYIGAISDWFDYDGFEFALRAAPEVSFVMLGPIIGVNPGKNRSIIASYAKYGNFHYLGVQNQRALRGYLAHSDAGIIPFRLNSLTHEINPLKLFEYSSFGVPTVASAMNETMTFGRDVYFYRSKEEFVAQIYTALSTDDAKKNRLKEFARENTWEKRFAQILRLVGERTGENTHN